MLQSAFFTLIRLPPKIRVDEIAAALLEGAIKGFEKDTNVA